MNKDSFIITIDGPAASGKSTTARMVAQRLGWLYLDTGAMYRAMTVKVLRDGIPLGDEDAIGCLAGRTKIELVLSSEGTRVFADGDDVTSDIRSPAVDRAVGPVCEVPHVREEMVALQRSLGNSGNVVAEGRDMGTVVFPDANLKFFMVASIHERAIRRQRDMTGQGLKVPLEQLKEEIERRDRRDSSRENSPLLKAEDAILIDTTAMDVQEQVDFVIDHIRKIRDDRHC
ncbi:MAG: (d)CMP kinase [bacterium]